MDNYLAKNRFSDYLLTMANLEARQLSKLASTLADRHLKNAFVRSNFKDDIQNFIAHQLQSIRSAKSDSQCQQCVSNLQQERAWLDTQDRQLSMGNAQVVASAQLVEKNGIWGYVINGVGIVLSGMQTLAGVAFIYASIPTGNVIGFAFGSALALHGMNGVQENWIALRKKTNDPEGFLKDKYIQTAEFMDFDGNTGRLAYSYMDLALSGYGLFKLTLRPQAWRLYYFIRSDYVRNIKNMTKAELAIETYQDASAINSIYDNK